MKIADISFNRISSPNMTPHCLLDMFSLGEQNACTFVILYKVLCITDDALSGGTTEKYVIMPDFFQ